MIINSEDNLHHIKWEVIYKTKPRIREYTLEDLQETKKFHFLSFLLFLFLSAFC